MSGGKKIDNFKRTATLGYTKDEAMKRYDTRVWRKIKNREDMTENSLQSYVDSDDDSDYLMQGLNWRIKGDLSHLPKHQQLIIKRQREKAVD